MAEKIRRQAQVLQSFGLSKADMLSGYIEELELGDASNREGHAAKVYFNELFGRQFSRSQDCPNDVNPVNIYIIDKDMCEVIDK